MIKVMLITEVMTKGGNGVLPSFILKESDVNGLDEVCGKKTEMKNEVFSGAVNSLYFIFYKPISAFFYESFKGCLMLSFKKEALKYAISVYFRHFRHSGGALECL